jgi:hypothetical protein
MRWVVTATAMDSSSTPAAVDRVKILNVERWDTRTVIALGYQQPLGFEEPDRFPDGRGADAQLPGHRDLRQHRAGLKFTLQDHRAEPVPDFRGGLPAVCVRVPRAAGWRLAHRGQLGRVIRPALYSLHV